MSFCRITGKSRALPKSNYFPMLPPISPADARRFCRITGKSYGLPTHHFIPVLLATMSGRKKCKITNTSGEIGPHHYLMDKSYGTRKHIVLTDYRYVIPYFDLDCEANKDLFDILEAKVLLDVENKIDGNKFVYKVEEKRCQLVFSAKMEAAVRDGDIRDIMFAKDSDTILLKTKDGTNFAVDIKDFGDSLEHLMEGEGPREDVLLERERDEQEKTRTRKISKTKKNLSSITNIFETKEKLAENAQAKKVPSKKIGKLRKNIPKNMTKTEIKKVKNLLELFTDQSGTQDLVKPLIESWDWNTFAKEAGAIKNKDSVLKKGFKIFDVKPEIIKAQLKEVLRQKLENTTGFESIPFVGCYKPPECKPLVNDYSSARQEVLEKLENVVEKFLEAGYSTSSLLPTEEELFEVIQNICKGNKSELCNVPGLQIDIEDRKVFLAGEFMKNDKGIEIFAPGKSVNIDGKMQFHPGVAISGPKGPSFIGGQVVANTTDNCMHFQAGQFIDDTFHCGQTVYINDEPKFIEGRTILTAEGLKFVAGVLNDENILIPGQVLTNENGISSFICGQTITVNSSEIFVTGQNVQSEDNDSEWTFVGGQTALNANGEEVFLCGKTITTAEGSKFVHGIYIEDQFVPGISRKNADGELTFTAGVTIDTKQGPKFLEGEMVQTAHGEIFLPGFLESDGVFRVAKSVEEVSFKEPLPAGMAIDCHSLEVSNPSLSVFGYMIQTENGIEFYPEKVNENCLPNGKKTSGKLIKQDFNTKFVPGKMSSEGFTPGQMCVNEQGVEEFLSGQLVEG